MSHIAFKVPEDIWRDFRKIAAGTAPLMDWWRVVRMMIEQRASAEMFRDSYRPRY